MSTHFISSIDYDVLNAKVYVTYTDGTKTLFSLVPVMLIEELSEKEAEPQECVTTLRQFGYKEENIQ